jgi:hypothetical protein
MLLRYVSTPPRRNEPLMKRPAPSHRCHRLQQLLQLSSSMLNMERSQPSARFAAALLHGGPASTALCTELRLDGLARLATCSKSLSTDVQTLIVREGLGLLDRAVDTAGRTGERQNYKAVAWLAAVLLRKVPADAAEVTERLSDFHQCPLTQLISWWQLACVCPTHSCWLQHTAWWQEWRCGCRHSSS